MYTPNALWGNLLSEAFCDSSTSKDQSRRNFKPFAISVLAGQAQSILKIDMFNERKYETRVVH